jgi:DNA-binding transcriptional regulator YhcF (GntR family)
MPDSYPFNTYSGLLEPQHYKRIGSAIWLFLWCISSTTKEVEKEGITWGIVLGNKPLKLPELAAVFDVNEKTIRRWVESLEEHEYIRIIRAPYGIILSVKNSKKFKERLDKNVQSDRGETKVSNPERTDMSTLSDKNVQSNKDITEDIINTNNTNKDPIDIIAERFTDLKTIQKGEDSYPTARDYEAIARIVSLGVPISITIKLLEQCFGDYKKDQPNGLINSFKYCEKYIKDKYEGLLAIEQAKKVKVSPIKKQHVKKDKLPEWVEKQEKNEPHCPKSLETEEQKRKRTEELMQQLEQSEQKRGIG